MLEKLLPNDPSIHSLKHLYLFPDTFICVYNVFWSYLFPYYPLLFLSHARKISSSQHAPPTFVHFSKWTTKFDYGNFHDHGCEINYQNWATYQWTRDWGKWLPLLQWPSTASSSWVGVESPSFICDGMVVGTISYRFCTSNRSCRKLMSAVGGLWLGDRVLTTLLLIFRFLHSFCSPSALFLELNGGWFKNSI